MNRRGFTLVELMASLAISGLLLVTVMGLTARLSIASKIIRDKHPVESWKEILQQRLESDYLNARSIIVKSNEIVIHSQGKPDWISNEDGFMLPMPMRVVYSIQSDDNISMLVRTAEVLNLTPPDNRTIEFLCSGIVGFATDQPLATDVAPGTLGLQVFELNSLQPIKCNLVRHGMPE